MTRSRRTSKPTSEKRSDQTEQVVENRNGFGDNPRHNPHTGNNCYPAAGCEDIALMYAISAAEDPDEDVFAGNVAVDDTGDNNLRW